ncbi:MAG: hypothetical protein E7453_04450 [Ruminococcaceae bacterium]|nr:hypothetical protein [Oscillospiraceae bacterium]
MSKIVCDVCGAAYPETSSRCPVCGSVRYNTPEAETDTTVTPRAEREERPAPSRKPSTQRSRKSSKKNGPNVKLIAIIAAVVVLGVVLVALLLSNPGSDTPDPTVPPTLPPTEPPTNPNVPCTGITLSDTTVVFDTVSATKQLSAVCAPADTTDRLVFTTSDPTVVTVDEVGELVAIGPGNATITVICGDITATCEVQCTMQPETEPPTEPDASISLNREDFTLFAAGEKWKVYNGTIDVSLVTFTSSNDSVVTFINGIATAVAPGTATIYAEYEGQKLACIVRCSFKASSGGNGGVEEDNGNVSSGKYTLWNTYGPEDDHDLTIKVGENVNLYLKDADGTKITVEWAADKEDIVTIDGIKVTGAAAGRVVLTATHDGEEFRCVVRISAPAQ